MKDFNKTIENMVNELLAFANQEEKTKAIEISVGGDEGFLAGVVVFMDRYQAYTIHIGEYDSDKGIKGIGRMSSFLDDYLDHNLYRARQGDSVRKMQGLWTVGFISDEDAIQHLLENL